MPFEQPKSNNDAVTPADIETANQLVEENEVLKNNPRVQALKENDYMTEDGRQLDPGNFLSSMLAYIETQAGNVTQEDLNSRVEKAMVEHSVPPEAERQLSDLEKTD